MTGGATADARPSARRPEVPLPRTFVRVRAGRPSLLAIAGVLVLAVGLRAAPWLRGHVLVGVMEYDDGVYYAAARALLHGLVPYRDFTVVHPPLTSVLLLPAAAIGVLFGDPVGMAAARVENLIVECVNVWLVYGLTAAVARGTDRGRRIAPLVAATVYAVAPGAVSAGHTVMLEPLTNLFVLLAMLLLLRNPLSARRAVAGGGLLAAALSVKMFAAVYVIVAAVWLYRTHRDRLLLVMAGFVATAGLVFLPVAALAGVPVLWRDLVIAQIQRPSDGGASSVSRALSLFGVGDASVAVGSVVVVACAVGSAWAAIVARQRGLVPAAQFWPWPAIAALTALAFLRSPSYFAHYAGFFAPPLAIAVGATWALASVGGLASRRVVGLAVAAILLTGCFGSVRADLRWRSPASFTTATNLIPRHACVYTDAVSLAIAADRFRVPDRACPGWLDGRGQNLVWSRGRSNRADFYPRGFLADGPWQADTLTQVKAASFLLVRSDPRRMPEWTPVVHEYVTAHFREAWAGPVGRARAQLWIRVN